MVRNQPIRAINSTVAPTGARALLMQSRNAATLLDRIDTHLRGKHPEPLLVCHEGVYKAYIVGPEVAGEWSCSSAEDHLRAREPFVILPGERSDTSIKRFLPRLYASAPYMIYRL